MTILDIARQKEERQKVLIAEGRDFYVPAFEVKIGPNSLDSEVVQDILQVTYRSSLQEFDSFEITINNWDAQKRAFKYSDEPLFEPTPPGPGKQVELWMGYRGKEGLRRMLTGRINSMRPTFPAGGQPTLAVGGLNVLQDLRRKQESETYVNKTDNEIAKVIADRLHIDLHTESTGPAATERYEYVLQDNQFDIMFLMQRAWRIGYDLFVEEVEEIDQPARPKLHFAPSEDSKRAIYTLRYGAGLMEFQPTLSTANQVSEVVVRGWNPEQKKAICVSVTRKGMKILGVGKEGGQDRIDEAFKQRKEVVVDRPVRNEQEAMALAKEVMSRIAKDMIKATGSVVGLPNLRAGCALYLEGLGKRFSGRYFVTSATHTIGEGGYNTQFECRREDLPGVRG